MRRITIALLPLLAPAAFAQSTGFNQCIATVADAVRETLQVDSDTTLERATRDWFCEDEAFNSYLERHKNSTFSFLADDVALNFKWGDDNTESMSQRRQYCQSNQFEMNSRELYSTARTILADDYVDALDVCVRGLEAQQNIGNTVDVVLNPISGDTVEVSMKATPRSFGQTVPIATKLQGNLDCPALPESGIPLSRESYRFNCTYKLDACEVGYVNVETSTGNSGSSSFFVPRSGSVGQVYVSYERPVQKWVFHEQRTATGKTSGGGLDCDDDGSYEGGQETGTITATVGEGFRIAKVDNISCSGGAHWTCGSSWYSNSAKSVSASIRHHSCAGRPTFRVTYSVEKLVTENTAQKSDRINITAGGNTALLIPGDALNVAAVLVNRAGEQQAVSGIDQVGTRNRSGGFAAERTNVGVLAYVSEQCD